MDAYQYIKSLLVLIFLLSFFGVSVMLLKYLRNRKFYSHSKNTDLKIIETLSLDLKRKLIVCKFRQKEYIILLGEKEKLIDILDAEK